jgi:hypothetical protein
MMFIINGVYFYGGAFPDAHKLARFIGALYVKEKHMECPSCKGSISKLKAMDLAKEKREGDYVCPLCNCYFIAKRLPKSAIKKSIALLLIGLLAALPADLIWNYNIIFGLAYLIFVMVSASILFMFWVIPKSHRKQPFEVSVKNV